MNVLIEGVRYVPEIVVLRGSMTLAKLLAFCRRKHRWTLDDAAKATGISRTYIHDLETGKTADPSLSIAVRLADVYGIGIHELAATRREELRKGGVT